MRANLIVLVVGIASARIASAQVEAGSAATPPQPRAPARDWRAALARAELVHDVMGQGFELGNDGFHRMDTASKQADAELARLIAALPDGSPDLPEAACRLVSHSQDAGGLEKQLLRAIGVARTAAAGRVERLYASLRRGYLSVQPARAWRGDQVVLDRGDAILGSRDSYDCGMPDAGHLRVLLVELYVTEQRYPKDPFTGDPLPGTPTSKRGVRDQGPRELDALYRELVAVAPADAAVATVLDLASIYCERGGVPICNDRTHYTARALAIREHAMPPGDPVLADTRLVDARAQLAKHPKVAEAELRRILAEADRGASARLQAAVDLAFVLRARHEVEGVRTLEATFVDELAQRGKLHDAWLTSELADLVAEAAAGEHRAADATRILDAAIRALDQRDPACTVDYCDNRQTQIAMLKRCAELDPDTARARRVLWTELEGQLAQLHARQLDTARQILSP